jgi:hypothetical protein
VKSLLTVSIAALALLAGAAQAQAKSCPGPPPGVHALAQGGTSCYAARYVSGHTIDNGQAYTPSFTFRIPGVTLRCSSRYVVTNSGFGPYYRVRCKGRRAGRKALVWIRFHVEP